MDSYLDTWASGNAPLSKSITRDTLQSTSASNIIGRKLNSYFKVPKKSPDSGRPLIIEQVQNSTHRLKSSSKSPLRSASFKTLKTLKNLENALKRLDSPPRQSSRGPSSRRTTARTTKVKKNLINDHSNLILKEKSENLRKTVENIEKKHDLREKLEKVNKKIKEINSKSVKRFSKHRITDLTTGRMKNDDGRSSSRENDEIRARTRAEKSSKPRKIQEIPQIKEKKTKKTKKSPNLKKKTQKTGENSTKEKFFPLKSQKIQEILKNPDNLLKEKEKTRVLKVKKSSKSVKKSKNLQKTEEMSSSFIAILGSRKHSKPKLKKNKNFRVSSDFLSEKLKNLQDRVNLKYDLMMVESVIKIQRWFRRLKSKRARNSSCDNNLQIDNEWVSFLNTSYQEEGFSINSKPLKEEYFDSLSSNNPSCFKFKSNPSSFQLKRPKQLNLDVIVNPLISSETIENDSFNLLTSNSINVAVSPTFNQSLYKSQESQVLIGSSAANSLKSSKKCENWSSSHQSLEKILNKDLETGESPEIHISRMSQSSPSSQVSQDLNKTNLSKEAEVLSSSISNQSAIKEALLTSFSSKKAESVENSIEKDISELSSALVKSSASHSQEEKNDLSVSVKSYKIPISSPDLSSSISDLAQEVLEKELSTFLSLIKFTLKEKEVDPSPECIDWYLKSLFEELCKNEEEFLELANTPSFMDPLSKLALLQNTDVGELPKRPNLEIVLPAEIGSFIKNKVGNKIKAREIYVTMMFDCVNEALNHVRPFGLKGVPDPWICEPRLLFGEGELKRVYKKIKIVMQGWDDIRGGVFFNFDNFGDDEELQAAREERMSKLLCFDVNHEEMFWVDYEDEETQSKMDLADLILDGLLRETALLLN